MKAYFCLLLLFFGQILQAQTIFDLVYNNDIRAVKQYKGAVNLRDSNQATPLMWAAYKAKMPMFKQLIKKGADVTMKGWILHRDTINNYEFIYGSNMAIAAGENNVKLIRYLIGKKNIHIDDREVNLYENKENGWSALHWAVVKANTKTAKLLIRKGADINAQARTDFNQTPLILAINFDQIELAKLLVKKGANCNQGDMYGVSVLSYAFESQSKELVKILIENDATFNSIENRTLPEMLKEVFGVNDIEEL